MYWRATDAPAEIGPLPVPFGSYASDVFNSVTPGYFDTVGTRVLAGRVFTGADTAEAPRVFVINQSLARALFGDSDPVGRHFALVSAQPQWGELGSPALRILKPGAIVPAGGRCERRAGIHWHCRNG